MYSVQPQSVDVVVPKPHQRVVDDEAPDLVALRSIKVDGLSPRIGSVAEVRPEQRQIVSARTEVVVDDIQDDRETAPMGFVDETRELGWSAVRLGDGEES